MLVSKKRASEANSARPRKTSSFLSKVLFKKAGSCTTSKINNQILLIFIDPVEASPRWWNLWNEKIETTVLWKIINKTRKQTFENKCVHYKITTREERFQPPAEMVSPTKNFTFNFSNNTLKTLTKQNKHRN